MTWRTAERLRRSSAVQLAATLVQQAAGTEPGEAEVGPLGKSGIAATKTKAVASGFEDV